MQSTIGMTQKQVLAYLFMSNLDKWLPLTKIMFPFSVDDEREVLAHHQQVIKDVRKSFEGVFLIENKTKNIMHNGKVVGKHSWYKLVAK